MPDSPKKKKTSYQFLPNRPDTKALNKLLEGMLSASLKSPEAKSANKKKAKSICSPTAKKFQNDPSQKTLGTWLSKSDCKSTIKKSSTETKNVSSTKKAVQKSPKPLKISTSKIEKNKSSTLSNKDSENTSRYSKKTSKPPFKRFNSASSDELPTFKEKTIRKRPKQTETFKKYGVIIPSIDEIQADQREFTSYKTQVEEAQTLKEPTVKLPLSPQKSNQQEVYLMLDCKHLTLEELSRYFIENKSFLKDILDGRKNSKRHNQYHGKQNKLDQLTPKDLTYNTSMIVFTFEQLDHLVSLMQKEFDPEDKYTTYFFKVLLPELCFKIFMETHYMDEKEANDYLENRPVE